MGKHSYDPTAERMKNIGEKMTSTAENTSTAEPDGVSEPVETAVEESSDSVVDTGVESSAEDTVVESDSPEQVESPAVENPGEESVENSGDSSDSNEDTLPEVDSGIGNVDASKGQRFEPIRIPVNVSSIMVLAGLHSEMGASSIGAYVKYRRLVSVQNATGALAIAGLIIAVCGELFTMRVYSTFLLGTSTNIVLTTCLLLFALSSRLLLDSRVSRLLSGKSAGKLVKFGGWINGLSLTASLGVLVLAFISILNNSTGLMGLGSVGFGGFINDYSLMNNAQAGALIQTLPLIFYVFAVAMGIVTVLKYVFGRRKMAEEFDSMGDFKSLYRKGEAYVIEG